MILSDFLSRQKTGDSNPHEIIPISFSLRRVLSENYYMLDNTTDTAKIETDKYLVQNRPQTKSSKVTVPEVHGIDKGLNPHVKPERQKSVVTLPIDKRLPTVVKPPIPKPRIGHGRAGIRRKVRAIQPTPMPMQMPTPVPTPAPRTVKSLPELIVQSQEAAQTQHHLPASPLINQLTPRCITEPVGPRIEHRPIPPYPDSFQRPPLRPPDETDVKETRKDLLDLDMDRNINFEENSSYQEAIISEMYERPDKSCIQEPTEFKDLVDTTKLVQKFPTNIY